MEADAVQIRRQRRARELREQWTTEATLSLPLDEEELLATMGIKMSKFADADHAPQSSMTNLSERMDDWLLSFMHLEFDSADENARKTEPLPSLAPEAAHETITPKQSYCGAPSFLDLLYTPVNWAVMVSEEGTHHNTLSEDEVSDGEMTITSNIYDADEAKPSAPPKAMPTSGTAMHKMFVDSPDDEKHVLQLPTPSTTDGSTAIKYSPDSQPSPSTPGPLTSPKTATGLYRCPQCTYSCQRMCDLR